MSRLSHKTCATCGAGFPGGSTAKYCPACRAERIRQRDRERHQRKLAGKIRLLGSTDICALCGKEYTVNAGPQKHCPECQVAEAKRRRHEAWINEYYNDPAKRQQYLQRARQWAVDNQERAAEILRQSYKRRITEIKDRRRIRLGVKLRPLGRTEICPRCRGKFIVRERNQKYCSCCSETMVETKDKVCQICEKPLPERKKRYCSQACYDEACRRSAKERADRWKALKICDCGAAITNGTYLCDACKEALRQKHKELAERMICRDCGAPTALLISGRRAVRCQQCNDTINARKKIKYEQLKAAGICTLCSKNPAAINSAGKQLTLCHECNTRNNERMWSKKHGITD